MRGDITYRAGPEWANARLAKYTPTSQVEAVAEITPGKGKGRSELVVGAWRSELQTS
jgi:hypothetical protein